MGRRELHRPLRGDLQGLLASHGPHRGSSLKSPLILHSLIYVQCFPGGGWELDACEGRETRADYQGCRSTGTGL